MYYNLFDDAFVEFPRPSENNNRYITVFLTLE